MKPSLLLPVLSLGVALAAQKVPLVDHGERQLQLFDVRALLPKDDKGPAPKDPPLVDVARLAGRGDPAPPAPGDFAAPRESLRELGDFLRHFIDPPLGEGDDLQPLAGRWLALVGSPAQIACVERLLAAAAARRTELLHVEVHFVLLPAKDFAAVLGKKLVAVERDGRTTWEKVFPAAEAKDLLAALQTKDAQVVSTPRIAVAPLQGAHLSVINQTAFVQDFTITVKDGATIADPVVGIVWDGVMTRVLACFEPDKTIGVSCDARWQELVRPIPTFTTTLGTNMPVTLQLPRTNH